METNTITFDIPDNTVPLTRRLVSRMIGGLIWISALLGLALAFLMGFLILRLALSHLLSSTIVLMISTGLPAFIVGLAFQPLKHAIFKIIENHLVFQQKIESCPDDTNLFPIPDNLSGRQIGAYELQDVIGRGGMAEVYQAVGNDSIVAIKVMHSHYLYDEENLKRFQREGEFGLGMIHDHIVAVYEVGEIEKVPYLVMEFVDGEDLRSIIRRTNKYTINDVTLWMRDICNALDMAHEQGYIHRDIKPSNIMVRPSGDAVLMDFGIAKFKYATTHITGASVGTIDYMAPEQIQNSKHIDHRADIYSLGIVVYELLTGLLPFEGSIPQVMYAHMNYPPPDPRDFNALVPEKIALAVMKALAKNPNDRFQSAGEFALALCR
ncbi:MAG: serine/threonine-protein kinase [Anaerolineae bacterium]|nr:serine/threonine-protein kinase [Anaerolineae bacterium]